MNLEKGRFRDGLTFHVSISFNEKNCVVQSIRKNNNASSPAWLLKWLNWTMLVDCSVVGGHFRCPIYIFRWRFTQYTIRREKISLLWFVCSRLEKILIFIKVKLLLHKRTYYEKTIVGSWRYNGFSFIRESERAYKQLYFVHCRRRLVDW